VSILHWRILWRPGSRHGLYTAFWPAITNDSYVVITVAEASIPESPGFVMPVDRFIGDARHMVATNIAPFPGGVRFSVHWDTLIPSGDFPYLNIWTDITLFDASDASFWSVSDTESARFEESHPSVGTLPGQH
jgi:hypothetical protein